MRRQSAKQEIATLIKHALPRLLLTAMLPPLGGCSTPPKVADEEAQRQMLSLLMPGRIEIVEPFTRAASFDDDDTIDGIEFLLRAVNYLDNPGLMIVGHLRVELYTFVPASADHKGQQLDRWDIPLRTEQDQRAHWNRLTQMYEFRLAVNPEAVPLAGRFVLLVDYQGPLGGHLTDEFVLDMRQQGGPIPSLTASR
jgi:hypothetical protein